MAKNVKSTGANMICSIVSVVLCILMAACGFVVGSSKKDCLRTERGFERKIYSFKDLQKYGDSLFNDTIILMNDITIEDSGFHIGSEDRPFVGTFDGNGHKVTIELSSGTDSTSLFGHMDPGSVVRETTFVYRSDNGGITVSGEAFGGIANINDGRIENCKVELTNFVIAGKKGDFSPLVKINNGTISCVYVTGNVSKASTVGAEAEQNITFGGICATNKGEVDNVIVNITFNGFESLNSYNTKNNNIAAVIGNNNQGTQTTVGVVASRDLLIMENRVVRNNVSIYETPDTFFGDPDERNRYNFKTTIWTEEKDGYSLIKTDSTK